MPRSKAEYPRSSSLDLEALRTDHDIPAEYTLTHADDDAAPWIDPPADDAPKPRTLPITLAHLRWVSKWDWDRDPVPKFSIFGRFGMGSRFRYTVRYFIMKNYGIGIGIGNEQPPLASRLLPLASRLLPLADRHLRLPLASRLLPLADRHLRLPLADCRSKHESRNSIFTPFVYAIKCISIRYEKEEANDIEITTLVRI
ncbi:hypothetical protein M569_11505 [Genlisea aurea]|uniref:Uncharacterized protein n=1 Tax=Genlisea aurea TaxID=192259 RepID=S8C8S1_9LAMI|nr:hypothetical protein M569_11505 [Genlisea aurea]